EGDVLVLNRKGSNVENPRYLRINSRGGKRESLSLTNEGFRGIGVKKNMTYDFSVLYRNAAPGLKLHVELLDSTGQVLGTAVVSPEAGAEEWKKAAVTFSANATVLKAKFNLWFEGTGAIDLDMVSLFPGDTWKNRKGGLRGDMVKILADMKPGFIRFPGGCIVEGHELSSRYQWKKTVGPVENRELQVNRWNTEFAHRSTPDYFQTFGLGFFEYFQLAEDIGAAAVPILNCGMSCQYNTAELVELDDLGPYIQDALDLVEFANGGVETTWGKVRAEMGHPKPFNLKMMGIGNENWGPQYLERLALFTAAIKAKYPDMKLISSSGTDPDGERVNFLNTELRKQKADIIDEHYYRPPAWFLENASRYDQYDRNGAKVFAGEYAAHTGGGGKSPRKNNWEAALAEAAFMTGLERNAAVVQMASYAPLFAQAEGWQWTPDMIWIDNLNIYGTPNYYVQKLYSLHKGTDVVSILEEDKVIAGQDGIYASAVMDQKTKELIIKVVNVTGDTKSRDVALKGISKLANKGTMTVINNPDPLAENSFTQTQYVSPKESGIAIQKKNISLNLKPYSFTVLRIGMK
uniref:alpha-L-arabinofuranosidase C-terminal domain-containing protein n=1 Tax=Pedobacter sp. TaxID=1411316 RepID=UPI003D7FC87C